MDVYLAASIRGGRELEHLYPSIVEKIQDMGHHVVSAMFAEQGISDEKGSNPEMTDQEIYERDVNWIMGSSVVVAEITNPSIGVGREIEIARNLDIPVIALFSKYHGKKPTAMVSGDKEIDLIEYQNDNDLASQLEASFEMLEEN